MKNLLNEIIALFTRNWGLKLLALALAIVIYHSLKPADGMRPSNHDRTFFQTR